MDGGRSPSRKLMLFNPCRALVYTKDTTSLFFTDGYIADYEDYAANDLYGTFLITDQMTDNKADIYWTEFAAESNTCPPFTVTRTISNKYTNTNSVLVTIDASTFASVKPMLTITTNPVAEAFYNFNYVQPYTPLGTFDVTTRMTKTIPATSIVNSIRFTISRLVQIHKYADS